ncbi:MAG: hypothetical protein SCALA702_02650 [Melioribacteraceae bacterium]|nr:MAG: hypothetical protein SCALA702_02650 [Melioribacteraceae bacterium]
MEAYNIIFAALLFWSFAQNAGDVKNSFTSNGTPLLTKPNSYLQKAPLNISAIIILFQVAAIFSLGKLDYPFDASFLKLTSLLGYALMSRLQYKAARSLGRQYSPEIIVYKNHEIVAKGPYKFMRHPQYFGQVAGNIFAAIALANPFLLIFTLFLELPLYIKRARLEELLLKKYNSKDYSGYATKTIF